MNRRSFIGHTVTFLGGIAVAPTFGLTGLFSQRENRRVAVIGFGRRGLEFLRLLTTRETPPDRIAVCDVDARPLAELAGRNVEVFSNLREMARAFKPQLAYIATPDHHHAVMTTELLRMGCEVIVDPPVALNESDLDALASASVAGQSIWIVDAGGAHFAEAWKARSGSFGNDPQEILIEHRSWWTELPRRAQLAVPPAELKWSGWQGGVDVPFDDQILRDWNKRHAYAGSPMIGETFSVVAFALETMQFQGKVSVEANATSTSRSPAQRKTPQGGGYLPDQEECRLIFPDGRKLLWRYCSLRSRYPRPSETSVAIDGIPLLSPPWVSRPEAGEPLSLRRLSPDLISSTRIALTSFHSLPSYS